MGRVLIISVVSAVICTGVFSVWFPATMIAVSLYASLAILSVAVGSAFYYLAGYVRSDQHYAILEVELEKEQQLTAEVKKIISSLTELGLSEEASQANRLISLLSDYHDVIEQKFGGASITLSSYSQETGRVFKLVINNLKDILAAARSVRTIKQEKTSYETVENESLLRRQALVKQQESRIDMLMQQNRELLTALNETTVQVANIKDLESFELTESLNRLRELGERASAYSKN
jgi:hypothetical protein